MQVLCGHLQRKATPLYFIVPYYKLNCIKRHLDQLQKACCSVLSHLNFCLNFYLHLQFHKHGDVIIMM